MIKLNKKIEYAMMAILHLARQGDNVLVSAREIAGLYNIPPELLGKVMQKLVKADFIESVQGINGGYQLHKPLNEVDLFTLIDEIEGPFRITSCMIHDEESCTCKQLDSCIIKHAVGDIQQEINKFFHNITLDKFIPEKEEVISCQT